MLPTMTFTFRKNKDSIRRFNHSSDPRTVAVNRALAAITNAPVPNVLDAVDTLQWDEGFKEMPVCMVWLYNDIINRCCTEQYTFDDAVHFVFKTAGYRLNMYSDYCTTTDILEWVKQVVHDLYIELAH